MRDYRSIAGKISFEASASCDPSISRKPIDKWTRCDEMEMLSRTGFIVT
jgi:hypothetical protein